MEKTEKSTGLLETLSEMSGCEWISDLHTEAGRCRLAARLYPAAVKGYGASEWREAYGYITGEQSQGETSEEIFHALLIFLQRYGASAPPEKDR